MRIGVAVVMAVGLLSCGQAGTEPARAQIGDVGAKPDAAAVPADTRAPEELAPAFVVSSDPAEPIIRVHMESTFIVGVPSLTYTLFGDGRLERAETPTRTYNPPQLRAARSVDLDAQELHSLATLAAAPVLIESDPALLAAEFERVGSRMTDGSITEVEIRLTSYSRGAVSLAPVKRSFRMVEPSFAAKYKRDGGGKAVQALAAIVNGLYRLHAEKEKSQ